MHKLFLALSLTLGSAQAVTNVTIWYPWGPPDGQSIVDRANEFNAMQKDIKVNPVLVQGAGLADSGKFMTAVTSGQAPDAVLYWGQDVIPGLAKIGAIQALDDQLAAAGLKAANFNAAAWNAGKVGGKVYGVPQMSSDIMLFYNKDMFKAAGLQPPKTLAELDAAAEKLTVRNGNNLTRVGFVPWIQMGHPIAWTGIFGGSLVDAKGNLKLLNSGTLKALKWQETYAKKYGAENLNRFLTSAGNTNNSSATDPFVMGKVAMEINGQWHANYIKKYKPDLNYGVVPIPVVPGGKANTTWITSNSWLIPKGAKNAQAALKFIAYASQPAVSARNADAVYNVSPVIGASKLQKINSEPVMKLANQLFEGNAFASPVTPQIQQLWPEITAAFEAVQRGKQAPEAALSAAQKNLDQAALQNH